MSSDRRQRVEKVPGARRARLTPAPGAGDEPMVGDAEAAVDEEDAAAFASGGSGGSGPNDEQLRRDVPPHY